MRGVVATILVIGAGINCLFIPILDYPLEGLVEIRLEEVPDVEDEDFHRSLREDVQLLVNRSRNRRKGFTNALVGNAIFLAVMSGVLGVSEVASRIRRGKRQRNDDIEG